MASYFAIVRIVTDDSDDAMTAGEAHAELAQVLDAAAFPGAAGLDVLDVVEEVPA